MVDKVVSVSDIQLLWLTERVYGHDNTEYFWGKVSF